MTIDNILLENVLHLKSTDPITLRCKLCNLDFNLEAGYVRTMIRGKTRSKQYCCSRNCARIYKTLGVRDYALQEIGCMGCLRMFKRKARRQKFCCQSCATTYTNTHKTYGIRRSKLEKYIEEQLTILYPDLEIFYNRKDAINSELDIYIPSFKLAIELNGIFHYEPIFSQEQLSKCQNNDQRKMQACIEHGIELCIIDTSSHTYVTNRTSQKYLDIITDLINYKLKTF